MGTHMKTTIELSDALLVEAKAVIATDGITLRALVETGLRQVLSDRRKRQTAFKLRSASVKGQGLQKPLQAEDWERMRELAYEGRGGA